MQRAREQMLGRCLSRLWAKNRKEASIARRVWETSQTMSRLLDGLSTWPPAALDEEACRGRVYSSRRSGAAYV